MALSAAALLVAAGLAGGPRDPTPATTVAKIATVELPRVVVHARRLPPVPVDCPLPGDPTAVCTVPVASLGAR